MKTETCKSLTDHLGGFISESKKHGINQVLKNRTRYITVVLEDIYQPHNASAVIRSCDGFGIQDLHVIENSNEYTINPNVAQGASKWVDIYRYRGTGGCNTGGCLDKLEAEGYCLYATSPHKSNMEFEDIKLDHKIALLFGTELSGLSEQVISRARNTVKIPMYGFTESFNLSVCVALCLHTLVKKLHESKVNWHLSEQEMESIRLDWYRKSVKNAEILERIFFEKREK